MTADHTRQTQASTSRASDEGVFRGGDQPLVTVVITTYNRPSYLPEAIESVRRQTYNPVELIIVDDHSETPAQSILESMPQDGFFNIECIRHSENRGANAARNTGIQNASGQYVAFLDDDDRWLPEKIEQQVEAFQDSEDIGVTYTGLELVNGCDSKTYIPAEIEGDLTKELLCRNVVGTLSSVMVRTAIARETPLDEQFPSWADLEWYVRLSLQTNFHRVPVPLVVYTFDSHNRLSDDLDKKWVAYERFLNEFDELASQYGVLFRRKMRAWAAYRLGSTALNMNQYEDARQLFFRAFRTYPFEVDFLTYVLATVGGRYTHGAARGVKRTVSPILNGL